MRLSSIILVLGAARVALIALAWHCHQRPAMSCSWRSEYLGLIYSRSSLPILIYLVCNPITCTVRLAVLFRVSCVLWNRETTSPKSIKNPSVGTKMYQDVPRQENHMLSLESEIVRLSKDRAKSFWMRSAAHTRDVRLPSSLLATENCPPPSLKQLATCVLLCSVLNHFYNILQRRVYLVSTKHVNRCCDTAHTLPQGERSSTCKLSAEMEFVGFDSRSKRAYSACIDMRWYEFSCVLCEQTAFWNLAGRAALRVFARLRTENMFRQKVWLKKSSSLSAVFLNYSETHVHDETEIPWVESC